MLSNRSAAAEELIAQGKALNSVFLSPESTDCALLAAGGVTELTEQVDAMPTVYVAFTDYRQL